MNAKVFVKSPSKEKQASPRNQDFTTYKDFTSEKSLESADFEPSFGEINGSFYSSSNEAKNDSFLINFQEKKPEKAPRLSKPKEEETNYTAKPALQIEREEIKKSLWCSNCVFGSSSLSSCLII